MSKRALLIVCMGMFISVFCMGKARDEDQFKFYDEVKYDTIKISSVVLLPFKNEVGKQTSEEVTDLFNALKNFFEQKSIKVIDATSELEKQKIDIAFDEIGIEKFSTIGKALEADAVFYGTIYKFQTSKKGIATVGISGDLVLTSTGAYIYRARLAREKKISATKKWLVGIYKGESKKNREKALTDCVADLLNPIFDKLGLGQVNPIESQKVNVEEQKGTK